MGECLKIVRVEDGGLGEIVNIWLDITKGRDFPAGSVVVLASASHLTLHGVGGYVPDLAVEFNKIEKKFRGGVICVPGVPVLGGGGQTLFALGPSMSWRDGLGLLRIPSLGKLGNSCSS
jgi:hypothetical protein